MNLIRTEFRGTIFTITGSRDLTMKEFITTSTINFYFIQSKFLKTALTLNDFIHSEGWFWFWVNPINLIGSLLFTFHPTGAREAHLRSFFSI
jgi:hypothetical protein